MQDQNLPEKPDILSMAIAFLGINLMWIFVVIWVGYGLVPVFVLAVLINHLITRLDHRLN
ncbi:histidinol phosphate aminotransferase [Sedimentitalea sp. CY04]|uniref:Histidinol phosphate aminotransferase n=1 Tax=Parasedimentitalea denitrificans TaxID=2211118 RepID=A0ABX0W9N0_9RHOB|nr:histidinol phosphate aminotransferase [Sedimentitalea sp. CY04]NIZ61347.1 histidinol phosphate aminotransferase [Sedimentitalea sp. CY04]